MNRPAQKTTRPTKAASVLEGALRGQGSDFTIADAATRSGLPLRAAEQGLHALVSEYRGHLRVTEDGDLLFRFPYGFTKPWETRTRLTKIGQKIAHGALGVGRFVVRAWVTIVLLGYVAIFLALLIAMTLARSSGESRDRGGGVGFGFSYFLIRAVSEALFWTFHPFSPVAVNRRATWGPPRRSRQKGEPDTQKFYEKVNRFFFGPERPEVDPLAAERAILAELRAQKGRIGLADVMRVTGLPREEADPLMARLMLDYDGTVEVSEQGGIVYRFAEMRRTLADEGGVKRPRPVWEERASMPLMTGNTAGANLLVAALNGFNLLMSAWALSANMTIAKMWMIFSRVPLDKIPEQGTAIALGVVPLVFSIALFALPLGRILLRGLQKRRVAKENGRRALLREVLQNVSKSGVSDEAIRRAWSEASGSEPSSAEITKQIVSLGGDVDLEADGIRYRFPDLEAEAEALAAEREAASEDEAKVGPIVFSSELS